MSWKKIDDMRGKNFEEAIAGEVGKVFAAWIQERIAQYGFVEHHVYVMTVSKTGIRQNVIQKDYYLSLDMAKELAMVENNDKQNKGNDE